MVKYKIILTKRAAKESRNLVSAGLKENAQELLEIIQSNPYAPYPPYEKLSGDLDGAYARRINIQHRLVYEVIEKERVIHVLRMWTHYE